MKAWKPLAGVAIVAVVVALGWRTMAARRAEQQAQVQAATQRAQPVVELAAADVVRAQVRELQRALPISGSIKAIDSAFVRRASPASCRAWPCAKATPCARARWSRASIPPKARHG